jgi:hypothetical protein
VGIDPRNHTIRFANGDSTEYGEIISSMPLPELVPRIDGVPEAVLAAARRLAFVGGHEKLPIGGHESAQ